MLTLRQAATVLERVVRWLRNRPERDHVFRPSVVFQDGVMRELPECGFVTYYDVNAGAIDGTTHCGRQKEQHAHAR